MVPLKVHLLDLWVRVFNLFRYILIHIGRSKLLFVVSMFSLLLEYFGLKIIHFGTHAFNGILTEVGSKQGLFAMCFLMLFNGAFLAAACGIWLVPYLHQGNRAQLIFTLPVAKWKYPVAYAFSMLTLFVLQQVLSLGCYIVVFGPKVIWGESFRWFFVLESSINYILAFESLTFAFAVSSLVFGQVIAFLLGTASILFLQVGAIFYHVEWEKFVEIQSPIFHWGRWLYTKLPPVGELIFDLRKSMKNDLFDFHNFGLWIVWLLLFAILFWVKLQFPSISKTAEN